MTTTTDHPRRAGGRGFAPTLGCLVARELRRSLRAPAVLVPAIIIPFVQFFLISGMFSGYAEAFGIGDFHAFLIPTALLFVAINGGGGQFLVEDIDSGYFATLLTTPAHRLALLLGIMAGDALRVAGISAVVLAVAVPLTDSGVAAGLGGALTMIGLSAAWGVAYGAISITIAMRTGSPAATGAAFPIFFPFMFLAPSFGPREAMSGWVEAAATLNPLTYVVEAMRALVVSGWDLGAVASGGETAKRQGYAGVRWPKQVGPDVRESPSPIGPFLVWQQPHPIFLAELLYRADPSRRVLDEFATVHPVSTLATF
jgi:ABC-2 type transport system permease protein